MRTRSPSLLPLPRLLTWVLAAALAAAGAPRDASAVYASPIHGGCYIARANDCRVHVDPVTIHLVSGQRLEAAQIRVNGAVVYDFRTDVANPPSGSSYQITIPGQDFGVRCGQTYTVNILGRDSGDANFLNMGQTEPFTCPSGVP
jgi:hypothetical protein